MEEQQQIGENQEVEMNCKQEIKNPLMISTPQPSISPPSSSSNSPSHEFSFTISLHSSSTTTTTKNAVPSHKSVSPLAIDLSPADDIFFHGHLLPLHLLSHFPVSPRSSINSLDGFSLPVVKEFIDHQNPTTTTINHQKPTKSKTFSLFGLKSWKKGCHQDSLRKQEQDQDQEQEQEQEQELKEKARRKQRYDISNVLKRYVKMVRPMFLYKGRRDENNGKLHKQACSFSSGNLSLRHTKQELIRGRRGEFSAPASMRTSPSNSGLLVNYNEHTQSSTNDSTMEELQSAIQAAIAHCKNSIAVQDKPNK